MHKAFSIETHSLVPGISKVILRPLGKNWVFWEKKKKNKNKKPMKLGSYLKFPVNPNVFQRP